MLGGQVSERKNKKTETDIFLILILISVAVSQICEANKAGNFMSNIPREGRGTSPTVLYVF